MNIRKLSIGVTMCVVLGVVIALWNSVSHSQQSAMPTPSLFLLEDACFSADGGESWQDLGDGSELRRQRNDVIIRGHFPLDTKEGWSLNIYLQHLQMELLVNGEMIGAFGTYYDEIRPEWCADLWTIFRLPATTTEDTIEIRFYSLHQFGANGSAYETAISNMRIGEPHYIYQWLNSRNTSEHFFGLTLITVGIMLLGIAFAALLMKSPMQVVMIYTALLAVGEGLFWLASAAEIAHYVGGSIAFYNTGRSVSRMLTIYALLAAMANLLTGNSKKIMQWTACLSGGFSFVFLLLNLFGVIALCEYMWIWQCFQAAVLSVALVVCVVELIHHEWHKVWNAISLFLYGCACISIMLDYGDQFFGWYPEIGLSKIVCGVVAVTQASALLVQLPASYAAIKRAEKLSEELHQSRIVLAMSQIRTHFIFNVLNAISGLCKSAPELADQELVRFSRYLRNNIDIMQEDRPIPFEKALEHMHNYVDLEQMRFEEKILLDENYEVTDFQLPSLVVQPLVENAIKHGLLPKEEGGIISVSTRQYGKEVMIEIADNGVGFDTKKEIAKTSVGLSNVRFRVERMMGGRLYLQSTPGKGTVVQVWLPHAKEDESCTLSM